MFWKVTRLLLVAFAIGSAITGCSEEDPVSTSGKPALTTFARTYGDDTFSSGLSVQPTIDGGYVVTGYRDDPYTDLWLFKTNASGEMVWEQLYGGADEDRGYRVELVGDGGYVVVGTTESFGAARSKVWILKTDAAGRVPGL